MGGLDQEIAAQDLSICEINLAYLLSELIPNH